MVLYIKFVLAYFMLHEIDRGLNPIKRAFSPMKAFATLNRKLLWAVLISSSIITTIITVVSLYTEYESEVQKQNSDIKYLERSFIPSIELSMWTLDRPQTLLQIRGMLASHNIFRILIRNDDKILFDVGKDTAGVRGNYEKKYPLTYTNPAGVVSLGELSIFVTKDAIYDRLFNSVLRIFFAQSVKTLLVSFVLWFVFQQLITRRLKLIGNYVQTVDIQSDRPQEPLRLESKSSRRSDEIDLLVEAMNYHIQRTKSYQEHVIRLKDEAQKANRTKSLFLGSVSHELRTPLNTILGMGELLQKAKLTEEYQECVNGQLRAGNHLRRMIDDLLDLTKIEAGQLSIESSDFDLAATLRAIVEMLRIDVEARHNTIELELAPGLPKFLRSDINRLTQVLLNLLGNANKFTENGSIRLKVEISAQNLQMEVIDSGIGIAPEDQKNIFEPFRQVEQSYSKKYKGAGIGLSLSRLLSRALGGDISVESQLGQGSRFIFTIPLVVGVGTRPAASVVPQKENLGRKISILFADDDLDNQVLLQLYMKDSGHSVYFAEDGEQAVEMAKALKPELIFMDIQMPKMNGYEAVKIIRETEKKTHAVRTPIVALTAFTSREDQQAVMDAGCDDYASKPVSQKEIFRLINKYSDKEVYHKEYKEADHV